MTLNQQQIFTLMQFVATVTPDHMSCDGCLELVPELAESQLGNKPLTEVLEDVQNHIDNCPCCEKEYESFCQALMAIGEV